MIALLAAAAMAASPAPAEPDAYAMGRGAYLAGFCGTLGWETSEDRVTTAARVWLDRQPDSALDAISRDVDRGLAAGEAEVTSAFEAYDATRDAAALSLALRSRCDAAVSATPELLSRTPETDRLFEGEIARMVGNGG